MKGLKIKNSVSSVGMPKKSNTGDANFAKIAEIPLIAKSSTMEKIATRYGNVPMQRSTELFAPETKQS